MRRLLINLDDDNRPIIEGSKLFAESVMRTQYTQCFEAIESILRAQKYAIESNRNLHGDVEFPNNIVVFDGDRGSGKTSVMLSVAQMLMEDSTEPYKNLVSLSGTTFARIPMLEPAFFDKEHNVLSLIVSRLYQNFSLKKGIDPVHKRSLLDQFSDIQNDLQCMFGDPDKQDALEYLVNLSAAISLRTKLQNLIGDYLMYVEENRQKLLILIDDIDLNHDQANRMLEEIRKYLILDNCVVLVSVKIDQLSGILYRNNKEEYKHILESDEVRIEIRNRVERYLNKLFPLRQRVFMPQPEEYLKNEIIVNPKNLNGYLIQPGMTVEQLFPEVIFAKTRYLFYNTRKVTSYIVPRNLRSIRQMLKFLAEMPNYKDGDVRALANKEVFKHYFFHEWVEQNIHPKHKQSVEELIQRTDLSSLNYVVVKILNELIVVNESLAQYDEISHITARHNPYYNISLGDVFSMIRVVENLNFELPTQKLLFFIKAFYSIRLYEAYDTITPDVVDEVSDEKYLICRKERGVVKDDYQAIVAGSVFNSKIETFGLKVPSWELRVDMNFFKSLLNTLQTEEDENNKKLICSFIEFYMLFVSYHDTEDTLLSYRNGSEKYYATFDDSLDYHFVGSIGGFLYNLSHYKDAINRFRSIIEFGPFFDLYDQAEADTLYKRLKTYACDHRKDKKKTDESKLLSVCCFRNMEILEDFYEKVTFDIAEKSPSDVATLASFFKIASEYYIYSYDRIEENGTTVPYVIDFKFMSIFYNLLDNTYIIENRHKAIQYSQNALRDSKTNKSENMFGANIP